MHAGTHRGVNCSSFTTMSSIYRCVQASATFFTLPLSSFMLDMLRLCGRLFDSTAAPSISSGYLVAAGDCCWKHGCCASVVCVVICCVCSSQPGRRWSTVCQVGAVHGMYCISAARVHVGMHCFVLQGAAVAVVIGQAAQPDIHVCGCYV